MDRFPEPRSHVQKSGVYAKAVPDTGGSALALPVLGLGRWSPGSVYNSRTRSPLNCEDSNVSIQASSLCSEPRGSCPRQLKESLASPGRSPGTHLKAGKHSHWKGRGEEWAQPGVGKTLAVPIPNTLTSHEILLRMGYMDQGCPQ